MRTGSGQPERSDERGESRSSATATGCRPWARRSARTTASESRVQWQPVRTPGSHTGRSSCSSRCPRSKGSTVQRSWIPALVVGSPLRQPRRDERRRADGRLRRQRAHVHRGSISTASRFRQGTWSSSCTSPAHEVVTRAETSPGVASTRSRPSAGCFSSACVRALPALHDRRRRQPERDPARSTGDGRAPGR